MTLFVTRRSQIPGSHFKPTNQELIQILHRKIDRGKSSSFITDMHVYEKEPWLLQHVRHFRSVKNQWYYFVSTTKPPGKKKKDSKKTSRTVVGFTWKNNTTTPIENEEGVTIGYMESLTLLVKGHSSGWVMHKFRLDKLRSQPVVLCKISFTPGTNNAQYAPRLEPIVIGQPQPPREESAKEEIPCLEVQVKIHQGVEQQQQLLTGSRPSEVVSYPTGQHQQLMNGTMEQYQDFGSFGPFAGAQQYYQNMLQGMPENQDFGSNVQYWGRALAQNHLPWTHQGMEPEQQDNGCFGHNVFENIAAQQQQQHLKQHPNFSATQQCMMEHREFGSSTQILGEDVTQYHLSVVPMEVQVKIHQGVEQQQQLLTGSCPTEVVSYQNGQHQQLMNGTMDQYQDFGAFGPFAGAQRYYQNMLQGMPENQDFGSYVQYWGRAFAQNHLPWTHQGMEPEQQDNGCFGHNVFENIAAQQQQQHLKQHPNFSATQQCMIEHREFGSSTQILGGDVTQYHLSVVPMEAQQGIEPQQHDNSCFGHNVFENQTTEQQQQYLRQHSNLSVTQQDMMEHQDFGSSTQLSGGDFTQDHISVVPMETQKSIEPQQHDNSLAHQRVEHQEFSSSIQFSGGDFTQNHLSVVPMETQTDIEPQQQENSRFGHNVVENETTDPPNLTQEQNQPLGELDETDEFVNWERIPELEDMTNFGNKIWRKLLGENTPEEEAELTANLGNCKNTASLINYFCPI